MGHYEDFWYEVTEDIKDKGLRKEFDKQLKKMNHQDHHKFKDTRARWSYAHTKVVTIHRESSTDKN